MSGNHLIIRVGNTLQHEGQASYLERHNPELSEYYRKLRIKTRNTGWWFPCMYCHVSTWRISEVSKNVYQYVCVSCHRSIQNTSTPNFLG